MSALSSNTSSFRITCRLRLGETASAWSPWPLRLVVGYGFIVHGWAKLSRGPESFAMVLHNLDVPLPLFLAWATTITELGGGLLVLCGAFVAAASVPLSIVLLTALFTVHLPYGFFSVKLVEVTANGTKFGPVGYEHILLYLAGLMSLAIGGAGAFSVDAWRSAHRLSGEIRAGQDR